MEDGKVAAEVVLVSMDERVDERLLRALSVALPPNVRIRCVSHRSRRALLEALNTATAVVLSGSKHRVGRRGAPRLPRALWDSGVPLLGVCYGFEAMMAAACGSRAVIGAHADGFRDYARPVDLSALPFRVSTALNAGGRVRCRFRHNDYVRAEAVVSAAPAWRLAATSPDGAQAWAAWHPASRCAGVQFHPERGHAATPFFRAWWAYASG